VLKVSVSRSTSTTSSYWQHRPQSAVSKLGFEVNEAKCILEPVLLGVRKSSPPQPRYKDTWDVSLLVRHIQRVWPDNSALSDEEIRNKAMVLLRLSLLARSSDIARALLHPAGHARIL
jgi:hypothetical protein